MATDFTSVDEATFVTDGDVLPLLARTPLDWMTPVTELSTDFVVQSPRPDKDQSEMKYAGLNGGPITRTSLNIEVQSLSAKTPVGVVAEQSDEHPSGIFVFSSAQKYRLLLNIDLSDQPAGTTQKFDAELSLQLKFTHSARKKPPVPDGNWEMFLSRVETLIEQDSPGSSEQEPDLKHLLHLNEFKNVPVKLYDGKLRVVTRIWPCLWSGSKRRTKQEDHENIQFVLTVRAASTEHTYAVVASNSVQVCVVPKSSYYKRKQRKPRGKGGLDAPPVDLPKRGKRRQNSSTDDMNAEESQPEAPLIHFSTKDKGQPQSPQQAQQSQAMQTTRDEPRPSTPGNNGRGNGNGHRQEQNHAVPMQPVSPTRGHLLKPSPQLRAPSPQLHQQMQMQQMASPGLSGGPVTSLDVLMLAGAGSPRYALGNPNFPSPALLPSAAGRMNVNSPKPLSPGPSPGSLTLGSPVSMFAANHGLALSSPQHAAAALAFVQAHHQLQQAQQQHQHLQQLAAQSQVATMMQTDGDGKRTR